MCDGTETGVPIMSETTTTDATWTASETPDQTVEAKTFTQEEVDRIVLDRAERIAKKRYADYDDLKAKAGESKTLEDRLADLEKQNATLSKQRLVAQVQARHGISDEDAALFLTGTDEDTLTAQAARLAEHVSDRKKQGNFAPNEGKSNSGSPNEQAAFVGSLFERGD